MRVVLAGVVLICVSACAQSLVEPGKISAAAKYFERRPGEQPLKCEVWPIPPRLGFSFRFQAGYVVRVPMNQYVGPGHSWNLLTRVAPEGGDPVYLANTIKLPSIPKTKVRAELGGTFLVGEGRYSVDWVLTDDRGRIFRKSWQIEAKLNPSERGVKIGIAPGSVSEVSFRQWSPEEAHDEDVRPLRRLTVLLHAAPLYSRTTTMHIQDRVRLLGSLVSLLESLPARAVRLVAFNLDQQKELFRRDDLTPDAFGALAESVNALELNVVSYGVLKNTRGHMSLLAEIVNQELSAADPSDAVIFLGPATRYLDRFSAAVLEQRRGAGPPFFYFQYRPYFQRSAELPDSIASAIGRLKGKMIVVRTPNDFAKAIKQVQAQVQGAGN